MKKPEPLVLELVKKFQMFLSQKKRIWLNEHTCRKFLFFSKSLCVQFSDTTQFSTREKRKAAVNKHPKHGFISLYLEIRLILGKILCLGPNSCCGLYFILLTGLHCCHNRCWYWKSQQRPSVRLIIIPRVIALDVNDLDQASALKHKPGISFWKHL